MASSAASGDSKICDVVHVDCVVIGAGWTGLATAASLRSYGSQNFVVLEAGLGVGSFWEGNYDRIKLHTPWHGLPCDGGLALYKYPIFKPKKNVVQYLNDYHKLHHLEPHMRLGERVTRLARESPGTWHVDVSAEFGCREYRCKYVAVCTSKLRVPYIPDIPGRGTFQGRVLHSREYRTGHAFRGKDVVVVGSGNSAAEICADLVECGAREVTMLVYGPRLFIPLPRLARVAWIGRILGRLTEASIYKDWQLHFGAADYWEAVHKKDAGMDALASDLTKYGIEKPELGFSEANIKYGRIGTFDQGAIAMIESGRVRVCKAKLLGFTDSNVCLNDGSKLSADAVVLATGFQPKLEEFIEELGLLESNQEGKGCRETSLTPRTDRRGRSIVDSTLFFVGFDQAVNGGLSMGFWGWSTGFLIAQGLGFQPANTEFSLEMLPELQRDVCQRRTVCLSAAALVGVLAVVSVASKLHFWARSKL